MSAPELSIIVTVHNMEREAPRTLHSLSPAYQLDVDADRYEVIVVDSGSAEPLGAETVARHGRGFRYVYMTDAPRSPAAAMNLGVSLAKGDWIGLMIDGARIVTPGILALAVSLLELRFESIIETIGFHLGPEMQVQAAEKGYDRAAEDALLADIDWPTDGYRLFEIAALAGSSSQGWFAPIGESNCLFLPRATFERSGGYDERFDAPGGGYLNLEFYRRLTRVSGVRWYRLLGEASFHQYHGGAATGLDSRTLDRKLAMWSRQYARIIGEEYRAPNKTPILHGAVGPEALEWMKRSASGRLAVPAVESDEES